VVSPISKNTKAFCLKRKHDEKFFGGFDLTQTAKWVEEKSALMMTVDEADSQSILLNCYSKRRKI
jgi:hypothetical protein